MAENGGSPMPGWAAFDKDEEPPPRRRVSPTAVVVVAGVVAAGVVAAGALWPEPAPTRAVASEPDASPTALPTASATSAPTLPTSPPAPSDGAGAPGTAGATGDGTSPPPPADGAQPAPSDGRDPGGQGSAAAGQPAAPPAPAPPPAPPPPAPPASAPPAQQMTAPATPAASPLSAFVTAAVPATSPDAVDGASRPVGYAASNLLDGHPSTAWRADGDLTGQVLIFSFDRPREISRAGLVNGYAKVDPVTGADRYAQSRRITQVTWTIDGQQVVQQLHDHDHEAQTATFPPVTTQSVTMRIDAVTAPGHPRLDQTVISEIVLADD